MINPGARQSIVQLLPADSKQVVWEIGPGIGAITHLLLGKYEKLKVFEIDHGFIRILKEEFGSELEIIEGDALKTWVEQVREFGTPDVVVGNLPYSVGSAMIGDFLEKQFLPGIMVYTLQKEVVKRMISTPGKKDYSSFSVLCQAYYTVENCGDLKPGSFFPQPEVTSAIVKLTRKVDDLVLPDPKIFHLLLRGGFSSRRKTLGNNYRTLSSRLSPDSLGERLSFGNIQRAAEQGGIDLSRRAEEFTSQDFVRLAGKLSSL